MRIVRTGPLTWGQQLFWFYNHTWWTDHPGSRPEMTWQLAVPDGTRVADLGAAAAACAERFEALRTVYTEPGAGRPEQCVLSSYDVPVLSRAEAERTDFGILDRPAVRVVVPRSRGRTDAAELTVNCADLDGFSLATVARLIEARLDPAPGGPAIRYDDQFHNIDWAHLETGRLRGRSERGMRWAEEFRRAVPRNVLLGRGDRERIGGTRQRSAAMVQVVDLLPALTSVAERCGVTVAAVVHATAAIVLSGLAGGGDAHFHTAVANRWRRETRHMVGRVATATVCRVPVDPAHTARQLCRDTQGILLRAYQHSQRDFGACRMNGVRADAEFGGTLVVPAMIEYFGYLGEQADDRPRVLFDDARVEVRDGGIDELRFEVAPLWPGLRIDLVADTAVLPPGPAVDTLHRMVGLLRAVAEDPDRPVADLLRGVPPIGTGDRPGPPVADAAQLGRRIAAHDGVDRAAVFVDDAGPSPVRAHLSGTGVDLTALHEDLMLAAAGNPLLRVPTSYRLVRSAPDRPASEAAWRGCEATGRFRPREDYRRTAADDERIAALVAVFQRWHPGVRCDPSRCYAQAGGEYLLIPSMMVGLRTAGYAGAQPADFIGLASLAAVARKLSRIPGC
ncbi:condensation domain-containing protein [Jidongwangia harbinensis]|uniref:condensation domain-containing protein n=1 Tax=Jidongwangia harbinensis TaxID=2878561 RepID=UPI001CD97270|nr:condensation domain-containing protein [Jidongwangia harbinensis]MCA2211338.1 condensation domain-containing protein [Jidongwangia harbinensis]